MKLGHYPSGGCKCIAAHLLGTINEFKPWPGSPPASEKADTLDRVRDARDRRSLLQGCQPEL
jgi:hypothetical protein